MRANILIAYNTTHMQNREFISNVFTLIGGISEILSDSTNVAIKAAGGRLGLFADAVGAILDGNEAYAENPSTAYAIGYAASSYIGSSLAIAGAGAAILATPSIGIPLTIGAAAILAAFPIAGTVAVGAVIAGTGYVGSIIASELFKATWNALPPDVQDGIEKNIDDGLEYLENLFSNIYNDIGDYFEGIQNLWNQSLRPNRDPLILDLGNDGIALKSMAAANVYFDMDNDGVKERTGWITGDDGFLAIDGNGNGVIDNVGELIGDPGRSGFAELKSYDSNNDGQINSADSVWSSLRIWRDLDADGITDAGELQSLAANGVGSFSTNFTTVNFSASENLIHEQGYYQTTGGAQRQLIDAWLQTDNVNTSVGGTVSSAAAALPDMRGYGALANLHQAMTANGALLTLVQQFVALTPAQFSQVEGRIEAIMMSWAGATGIDPASRGGNFDARKLAVLEAITGTPWVQPNTNPPVMDPPAWAVANLTSAYALLVDEFAARFLAVGPLASTLDGVLYSSAADRILALQPFESYIAAIDAKTPADAQQAAYYWSESLKVLRSLGLSNGLDVNQINTKLQAGLEKYGLDHFVAQLDDPVNESATSGARTVDQTQVLLLGAGVDNVTVRVGAAVYAGGGDDALRTVEGAGYATLYGEAGNDFLSGANYSDFLNGGLGADWMEGGNGNDVYIVDNIDDIIVEADGASGGNADEIRTSVGIGLLQSGIENVTLLGSAAISVVGNNSSNIMRGNAGQNTFSGGMGDDTYYVSSNDNITEKANEGIDTVHADGNYVIYDNIENLHLTGTGNFSISGNGLNNYLYGNSGNNTITGGGGQDIMYGGAGNDFYFFDQYGDAAYENAGEGFDRVYSTATVYLSANIELLILQGAGDIDGTGNAEANTIYGNVGNNHIDGSGGGDLMVGGKGDDTYVVDNAGDVVNEAADSGYDKVLSYLATYTMTANVEFLQLASSGNTVAFGNSGNNRIEGSNYYADTIYGGGGNDVLLAGSSDISDTLHGEAGNDQLEGGAGADTMTGGTGNDYLDGGTGVDTMTGGSGDDYYVMDVTTDIVVESAGGGTDTIRASTSIFALVANIENVELAEGGQWDINGNSGANQLTGNSSANVLDGKGGADILRGMGGDDTYLVDVTGDRVYEDNVYGTDHVKSFVSFALGANLENLTLLGSGAINGTGNERSNTIVGNAAQNIIVGGKGYDILTGGAGKDTFKFLSRDITYDRITDFQMGVGGDVIDLSKLLRSMGYTGADPVADQVLRIRDYTTNQVSIEVNNGTTTNPNWVYQVFVESTGITAAALASSGQVIWNSTSNLAPVVMDKLTDQIVTVGSQLVVRIPEGTVVDFDSETITWSAVMVQPNGSTAALPSWLVFNAHVPAFVGTPPANATDFVVRVTARDERGLAASFDMDIEVIRTDLGDQILVGTEGNDTFNPGAGDDVINAGEGDDTIVFTAEFAAGETNDGTDRIDGGYGTDVISYLAMTSGVTVNLQTGLATGASIGTDKLTSIETVIGTNLADTFLSGVKSSALRGMGGDDTYRINHLGARVIEAANGGTDTVYADVSFTAETGMSIERILAGTANRTIALKLTGNEFNQLIVGNAGANTLNGGKGTDTLTGEGGNDTFVFNKGYGRDTVTFFMGGTGSGDVVDLRGCGYTSVAAVLAASVQVGADLEVRVTATDVLVLKNFSKSNFAADDMIF